MEELLREVVRRLERIEHRLSQSEDIREKRSKAGKASWEARKARGIQTPFVSVSMQENAPAPATDAPVQENAADSPKRLTIAEALGLKPECYLKPSGDTMLFNPPDPDCDLDDDWDSNHDDGDGWRPRL